jgi:hypothetical protein
MKTKNLANFGIFLRGNLIASGDILLLIEIAQTFAAKNKGVKYSIATLEFLDSEEMTSIEMGTEILAYRNIDGTIYITNEIKQNSNADDGHVNGFSFHPHKK